MKILVTGSNGFIGKYICEKLKKNHKVTGVGTKENSGVSGIDYIQTNIESVDFVNKISKKIKKCDIIIHLAALIDKEDFNDNLINVNCKGSLHIVELAKEIGVKKIIHSSGLPVIGKPIIFPITEDHPINPHTLYHITKLTSEYIINLSSKYGIKPINLRIPSPIGPEMNEKTLLPTLLIHCLNNEPIIIYGKGLRKQNYIDVRDIAETIDDIVNLDIDGTYNITSEEVISNIDLAKLCIKMTSSKSKIIFNGKEDPEDDYCWKTSIDKAKKDFSFKPKYSLNDSINNILSYLKK